MCVCVMTNLQVLDHNRINLNVYCAAFPTVCWHRLYWQDIIVTFGRPKMACSVTVRWNHFKGKGCMAEMKHAGEHSSVPGTQKKSVHVCGSKELQGVGTEVYRGHGLSVYYSALYGT